MNARRARGLRDCSGQSLLEFSMILPLLLTLVLGVVEIGYALLDQQVITKVSREGSNLISRDTSLQDAATALSSISNRPVNFSSGSKLIFSVIKRGATSGTSNYDKLFLYQRHQIGTLGYGSKLNGSGAFLGAPDYIAVNSDNNASLQVTNVPANLIVVKGGLIYVTEVYTTHVLITPLNRLGITVPETLYSIAYF